MNRSQPNLKSTSKNFSSTYENLKLFEDADFGAIEKLNNDEIENLEEKNIEISEKVLEELNFEKLDISENEVITEDLIEKVEFAEIEVLKNELNETAELVYEEEIQAEIEENNVEDIKTEEFVEEKTIKEETMHNNQFDDIKVKIKVIGVGGAGGNAVNDMIKSGISGVTFIAANTDNQDLNKSLADVKIRLGLELTKGLGAGANPEVGKKAAEESADDIKNMLTDTNMLFIAAGMGGGTGTGAAPAIAQMAREMGILTVGITTKPFGFEGKKRQTNAELGIAELKKAVDTLVVIPNDKLFQLPNKAITMLNAFEEANNVLKIGVKGITEVMTRQGYINLDFADVRTVMQDSGIAMLGFGEAQGEGRAAAAAEMALSNPLLEKSIEGASRIILNITAGRDFQLAEAYEISDIVKEATGKTAEEVMFGAVVDDSMNDVIRLTLVATDFNDYEKEKVEKEVETKKVEINKAIKATQETQPFGEVDELDIPAFYRRKK